MKSVPKRIAIIGAGLAGATAAKELADDHTVSLFEKSRGAGGRMSSRRVDPFSFNHGAQFFTARSEPFAGLIDNAVKKGIVKQWSPKLITLDPNAAPFKRTWFEPHFIANGGMNNLAKALVEDLQLTLECQIETVVNVNGSWYLNDQNGKQHGPFDWVISTAPAEQTRTLMPPAFNNLDPLTDVQFSPCFALMLGFTTPVEFGMEAAVIKNSPLAWAVAESGKTHSTLLVHSDNKWAAENLEQDLGWVQQIMLDELTKVLPKPLPRVEHAQLHRWRYARCETPLSETYLLDRENGLGVCGDWCGGNRVEDGFISGLSLATALKTTP